MSKNLPKIVIVGRANVGKSTLFNRLIEKNKALVSRIAGTTRDLNIGDCQWRGRHFEVIDTGGLDIEIIDEKVSHKISSEIFRHAQKAIATADLLLFVVDVASGVLSSDRELAQILIKKGLKKKILLVGNKAETAKNNKYDSGIFKLGLGEPLFISAASGSGLGDLLDATLDFLPPEKPMPEKELTRPIRLALVGKPNVGKSSLLNAILGEERVIVSDVPHTTREAHDSEFNYGGRDYVIVDTAGLRKRSHVHEMLEKKSVGKSLEALKNSDIAILVTDVSLKIDTQDKKITQEILESGKSVIIVANKWDLIEAKETNTINSYVDYYRNEFPYLWWAPVIFVSAKDHLRAKKILEL